MRHGAPSLCAGLPSQVIIRLPIDRNALAAAAAREQKLINVPDAYLDARFDSSWDRNHGFVTKQVMCAPVVDEEGALLGIIQAINKDGGAAAFSEDDERLVRMLAKHIEIFIAKM